MTKALESGDTLKGMRITGNRGGRGFPEMFDALWNRRDAEVHRLLAEGADPNGWVRNEAYELHSFLHLAVQLGSDSIVRALVDAGVDVDERVKLNERPLLAPGLPGYRLGRTPLMLAAEFGRTDSARTLVNAGARLWPYDGTMRTALHYAEEGDNDVIAELLREQGASHRDVELARPAALRIARARLAEDWERHQAALNGRNHAGHTELMQAALEGHLYRVRDLLARGANPTLTEHRGQTAGQLASTGQVRALLLEAESSYEPPIRPPTPTPLPTSPRGTALSQEECFASFMGPDVLERLIEGRQAPLFVERVRAFAHDAGAAVVGPSLNDIGLLLSVDKGGEPELEPLWKAALDAGLAAFETHENRKGPFLCIVPTPHPVEVVPAWFHRSFLGDADTPIEDVMSMLLEMRSESPYDVRLLEYGRLQLALRGEPVNPDVLIRDSAHLSDVWDHNFDVYRAIEHLVDTRRLWFSWEG